MTTTTAGLHHPHLAHDLLTMGVETTTRSWDKIERGKITRKVSAAISLDNRIGNTYKTWLTVEENKTDEDFLSGTREKLREAICKLTADEIDLLDTLIFIANNNKSNSNA